MEAENKRLNSLVTSLHEQNRNLNLKFNQEKDRADALEDLTDELKSRVDDLEFDLNRTRSREFRLQESLTEAKEKLKNIKSDDNKVSNNESNGQLKKESTINQARVEDIQKEVEETKELANNRLIELETLNDQLKDTLKHVKKLEMDLTCLPANVIFDTVEYKCLHSQFSVLYNESMQLRTLLEDTRNMVQTAKTTHLRQIEHMESEELSMQKRLRTEVIQLEDQLAQVRKEYDMLRLEFEQSIAANEQNGPINKEMRNLITSLQNHNSQLKNEIQRYKRRLKESNVEIDKLKQEIETLHSTQQQQQQQQQANNSIEKKEDKQPQIELKNDPTNLTNTNSSSTLSSTTPLISQSQDSVTSDNTEAPLVKPEQSQPQSIEIKEEKKDDTILTNGLCNNSLNSSFQIKKEESSSTPNELPSSTNQPLNSATNLNNLKKSPVLVKSSSTTSDTNHDPNLSFRYEKLLGRKLEQDNLIRDLKNQIKKITDQYKELKILSEMHKSAPKDIRERAQLMANEKKYKIECEELRKQITKIQNEQKKDRKRSYDEDGNLGSSSLNSSRDACKLREEVEQLQKKVAGQMQEIEVLCKEMDLTGSAYEEMLEANLRLTQQLKEKDEANFKLMSERIKSQQIQKLLKEEKESLTEQILSLQSHIEAQNQVVRKLEEKERLLQNHLSTTEKELGIRQKVLEQHKRSAIEAAQSAADLKLHLDKYLTQLKEAQSLVAEKSSVHQQEAFKTKRLNEEMICWKRKYERAKKFELASTADEVLLEEIREYKEQLTCPSCKVNRKDAVLTKCFHVFCYDCLKTRYDSRQRKCPKCNGPIGANDFHRLYLA